MTWRVHIHWAASCIYATCNACLCFDKSPRHSHLLDTFSAVCFPVVIPLARWALPSWVWAQLPNWWMLAILQRKQRIITWQVWKYQRPFISLWNTQNFGDDIKYLPRYMQRACVHLIYPYTLGYFPGTGAIIWLPQCQRRNPEQYL